MSPPPVLAHSSSRRGLAAVSSGAHRVFGAAGRDLGFGPQGRVSLVNLRADPIELRERFLRLDPDEGLRDRNAMDEGSAGLVSGPRLGEERLSDLWLTQLVQRVVRIRHLLF